MISQWKNFWFLIILIGCGLSSNAQKTIDLYSGKIPGAIPAKIEEVLHGTEAISNVSKPTLTIYLPDAAKATGAAVIICPGGGYGGLVIKREGYDVAEAFRKIGVTAFVLKYRLPDDRIMEDKSIGPLQDAQQAILKVRKNAKSWGINPAKIGIMGFSAGGHLASTVGTHFRQSSLDNPQKISVRPDFMILVYPVINFSDSIAHIGSRENLLGKDASLEKIIAFSNEQQVSAQTPPAFLVHASDDKVVPVENSVRFYEALKKYNSPSELHIYPRGDHGFLSTPPFDEWFGRCVSWMKTTIVK